MASRTRTWVPGAAVRSQSAAVRPDRPPPMMVTLCLPLPCMCSDTLRIYKQQISLQLTMIGSQDKVYDLTLEITSSLVAFPGDSHFQCKKVYSVQEGNGYDLCHMSMGNHTGTHVDYPCHVVAGAKNSDHFPIQYLMGPGVIHELPAEAKSITKQFVDSLEILQGDIVFFKTSNSSLPQYGDFYADFVYVEPEAAQALLDRKARIVGIDYKSVDKYSATTLPTHQVLLSNDVLIVEGLKLDEVPAGRYLISISPIRIKQMDGLPARVVAQPL